MTTPVGPPAPRAGAAPVRVRPRGPARLRQAVLALEVLDEVDLDPVADGVALAGGGHLSWEDVTAALGGWVDLPDHPVTRRRLLVAVECARLVAVAGADGLLAAVRLHGEPVQPGPLSPGDGWARETVPGGALVLGPGVCDLGRVAGPAPLPPLPGLAAALGARLGAAWQEAHDELDRLAGLVVERLRRDAAEGRPLVLRPVGGSDVVTLLGARRLRAHLASGDGTGMRAVAVPVRDRGWFDLARIDPAYVRAAWAASEPVHRAYDTPLLVTADEVAVPVPGGDVVAPALADPAGRSRRDVRWR